MPRAGAELIATPALTSPSLTSLWTTSPPTECPIASGGSGSRPMTSWRCRTTRPKVRVPSFGSRCRRSSAGSPSWNGQLGARPSKPAAAARSTHGAQLRPFMYMPCTKTSVGRAEPMARQSTTDRLTSGLELSCTPPLEDSG